MKQLVMSINGMYGQEVRDHIMTGISWLEDLYLNLECLPYPISEPWNIGMGMILLLNILNRK
jgi:hypothetical protein